MVAASSLFDPLETPFGILANRIVMAPMTRSRAAAGRVPGPLAETYYAQRASAGLVVTEATHVSTDGMGYPRTPGLHTPEQIAAWAQITAAVQARGARIACQMWHVGRVAHVANMTADDGPIGPTTAPAAIDVFTDGGLFPASRPRAMTVADITRVVRDFSEGARVAVTAAGFDAVEIHCANGYLLDQFCRDGVNRRIDAYGGDLERRLRFMDEVVGAVTASVGAGRVGVRLAPHGRFNDCDDSRPDALFEAQLDLLARHRVAYVHVILPEVSGDRDVRSSQDTRSILDVTRRRFPGLVIAAGGFDADKAARALERRGCHLVAFGRAFISNPDLPDRIRRGADWAPWDRSTFYSGGARGYVDYPELGADQDRSRRT